ncbi:sugar-binding transcriptional regulator [Ruania alba]|uniref:DNA-binding transcriptional regulator LsrR, DeoR family n=1 Tax=Ruania alba TaxID=648782 RepID=A0A1H5BNX6_9MICO|nr:sugar-binding domain-containing protein [Ruania alba]SED56293.1 DNA-binding transcriptional regulator LsrR, DeoR family [Ruania alba]
MRDDDAYRAATMYYLQDQTMEVIAKTLGVSRSTVSRLIKMAREEGIVRISLRQPSGSGADLGHRLSASFGIKAHVVPVRERATEVHRLEQVAMVAARLMAEWVSADMVVGVAWGTTVTAIARHLAPTPVRGSTVVQLNGAANTFAGGVTYAGDLIATIARAFDSTPHLFPVPAFFDFAETKAAMWRERSVRRVLGVQRRVDIALFGVGALAADVPSHVYNAGYLDDAEIAELTADRVVGDVCTVFLREDGTYRDIAINARATGPSPRELRTLRRRVCVAVGEAKVPALLGALRARVATDVILDETTARALLERVRAGGVAG